MYRGRVSDMDDPRYGSPEWKRMRAVQTALVRYAEHKDRLAELEDMLWPAGRGFDTPIVSTGKLSDPTARIAIDVIKTAGRRDRLRRWNTAVDYVYEKMLADDAANGRDSGIAYMMRCLFLEPDTSVSPNERERMLIEESGVTRITYRRWRYRVEDEVFLSVFGRPPNLEAQKKSPD